MDQTVNPDASGAATRALIVDAGPWASLPPTASLEMPVQSFSDATALAESNGRRGFWVQRAAIFAGAAVLTIAFAYELFNLLTVEVMTPLQALFLVLSTMAFGWIAVGSLSAALGFLPLFVGERPDTISPPPLDQALTTRTALLFPVYHEDPVRISATIHAIADDLEALGRVDHFDVFILSDTRDKGDGGIDDEAELYRALQAALASKLKVFYRRRLHNAARKAGNIADWVHRFGGDYDHFVILDADSVMSGPTLTAMALTMQRDDSAGLIQTVPRLIGGTTLLQRLQQFACNTYGPSVAAGLASWHRDQGNYWGHNAIIRTTAFAEAAGLPELGGRKPFAGHILSHDFVEAVLLQRAGWGVHMMPTIEGSYEGMPPNIVDVVVRDRRWAQGNLQHLAIVAQPGLTGMGRLHLAMGATSYLISAIWAMSLIVGVVLALQGQQIIPSYFQDSKTLFPIWPVFDSGAALSLFLATMAVVLLPKGLGLILEWQRTLAKNDYLGAVRVTIGVLIETIFSMLIAPILMLTQTVASVQILAGRDQGWTPQQRDDGRLSWASAMWFARWHTLIGVAVAIIAYVVSPGLLLWMLPVVLGLALAGPVSWWTARPVGVISAWALSTKEDRHPPDILKGVAGRLEMWRRKGRDARAGALQNTLPPTVIPTAP